MDSNKQLNIVQKLRQIACAEIGGPMPECLRDNEDLNGYSFINWGLPLSEICREAADEIEYWKQRALNRE